MAKKNPKAAAPADPGSAGAAPDRAPQLEPQPSPEGQEAPAQLAEREPDALPAPIASASAAVDASAALGGPPPGELPPARPELPPELDERLNGRERRTVWHMVAGLDYQQALTAAGIPPRAAVRDSAPPPHVAQAVDHILRDIAYQAGISRRWIVENTVALYRRAAQAEEVLDRRGRPTGVFKFDGATAARCLEMLGKAEGIFRERKPGQLDVGDVAALLQAVAARGRAPLAAPAPRLIGSGSAADAASAQAAPHNAIAMGRASTKPEGSGA